MFMGSESRDGAMNNCAMVRKERTQVIVGLVFIKREGRERS